MPLRILFLTHRLPYAPNRGDRLRAYHLLHTMARQARVDLVSLVHDDDEAGHAGDLRGVANSVTIARVRRLRNYLRGAALLPSSRPLTHMLLDSPEIAPAIARIARERPPDLVFAFCSGMMRFAMEAPLASVPCVLDMVDADSAKWRTLSEASGPVMARVYRREARCLGRFEIAAMQHARTTLVVNDRERDLLRALLPDARLQVVENGVDVDRFMPPAAPASAAPAPPPDHPTVVFCGVMNYAPNEEGARWLARDVWPAVQAARPDARLVLVGASPSPAVQALASGTITVTGAVPDVRPYLWHATAAVAPLWVARGVQNKVLEAVAAGLPCVVTPPVAEGLPEAVRPACPVAANAEEFARLVIDLLASPDVRRARVGAASLHTLSWPERLARLMPLLQDAARA